MREASFRRSVTAPAPGVSAARQARRALAFSEPRSSLELQLAILYERVLGVAPIGVRDSFFDLGGSSLQAVRLFEQIESVLGRSIPPAVLFEAPSVEKLAEVIRRELWAAPTASLVGIQPHGSRPPFFCAHLAFGHVFYYRDLVRRLGPDQPVYAFQAVGLDGRAPRHTCIEDMAAHYIAEMRAARPRGPYLLGGASYGGFVAFEMAQQLYRQGEEPALVALFDTLAPHLLKRRAQMPPIRRGIYHLFRRVEHHLGSLWMLPPEGRLAYVRAKVSNAAIETREILGERCGGLLGAVGQPLPKGVLETKYSIQDTETRYVPRIYPGRVTLFRAEKRELGLGSDPTLGWAALAAGGVEVHEVPGYHGAIIAEPRVRFLAEPLIACLARASGARPASAFSAQVR